MAGPEAPRTVAVICLRDEGALLLDWLAHHLATGIDHVVACSNACSDGTDLMLDRLAEMGLVTHVRNAGPYGAAGVQFTGLKLAAKTRAVRQADWLVSLDIDEFIDVRVGGRRLVDLRAALPEADAITLTWRLFGNDGVVRWEDRPVWEVFTRAAPEVLHYPWRAALFKTLWRNDGAYRALGAHRPRRPRPERLAGLRWVDGSGRPLPARLREAGLVSPLGRRNGALVQLNHYALGAMESFVLKAARGRPNRADQGLGLDYWVERNLCAVEERGMAGLAGPRGEIRASFAADARLDALHRAAVAWRRAKIDPLLQLEEPCALLGRLQMAGPSRLLGPETARRLFAYAGAAPTRSRATNRPLALPRAPV